MEKFHEDETNIIFRCSNFKLMSLQQFIIIGIAVIVSVVAGILIGTSMNQDIQTLDGHYAYDADTVYKKLQKNEIYVIDIRNESEYSAGYIPGSSIDYLYGDTLEKRINTIQKKLPDLTSDRKLVLVDNDGIHAKYVAKSMSDAGIETYFLKDGMDNWDKELTTTTSAKSINSEKLASQISQNEDIYLLDVREPAELEVTKIESSVNIPLSEIFEIHGMDDIPTDKPVIVICGSGNRAAIATYALAQNGIDFQVLNGGIKAWDVYMETSELDRLFEKMDNIHTQHQSQMSQMWQSMDDSKQQEFLEKLIAKITKMENMDMSEHFSVSNHGMDDGTGHDKMMNSSNMTMHQDIMKRGEMAMGFDQNKIKHDFVETTNGGEIRISALDVNDIHTIHAIRTHVKEIQNDFSQGDFKKPFFIHDQIVPGTQTMTEKKDLINFSILDTEHGGVLILTTNDANILDAIKQFMAFQSSEHMDN